MDSFSIHCECADEICNAELWLTLEEWERAKSGPNRSVLVPGHPPGAGEMVVEETDRYVVVEGGHPPV